jgi:non-heme chloroperoxidase
VGARGRQAGHQPNDVQYSTTQLATGVTLHYAERGDPTGEAIIFLHGYTDAWFSVSRVLPLLSPEYHASALTERGHGDLDKPECCYTLGDFAADVDAFMESVGVEEATLVGMSGGSFIAQRVALDYPHRVSRLVLISSAVTSRDNETVFQPASGAITGRGWCLHPIMLAGLARSTRRR